MNTHASVLQLDLLVSVVDFFGEAHHIADLYLCAVIEHGFSAHPAEDLMLV